MLRLTPKLPFGKFLQMRAAMLKHLRGGRPLLPEVRSSKVDQIIPATAHDGFEHVKTEPFRHFDRDAGGNRKHHPTHDRVDQNRPVMGECIRDATLDLTRILEPHPAYTDGLRHGCEVRILETGAG